MDKARLGLIGIVNGPAKEDFWGTMKRVADIGYEGIEHAGPLLEGDVKANLKRLKDLGLVPLTVAAGKDQLHDNLDKTIADAHALGVKRVSCWWMPAESRQQVLADAETFEAAGKRLAAEGLRFAFHHHDHEFATSFDGVSAFDLLASHTDPAHVSFIVDIAWVTVGGQDPVKVIRRLGKRVASLHVKDVSVPHRLEGNKVAWTAVGTGVVAIEPAIRAALEQGVEWAVVEQDQLRNLDPFETITLSRLVLKERGLI